MIYDIDFFRYQVPINFSVKGENLNTLTGAFLSIIYILSFLVYSSFCIYKMINHMQDNLSLI